MACDRDGMSDRLPLYQARQRANSQSPAEAGSCSHELFKCQSCQQILYFENTVCVKSGHRLGYIPEMATLSALEPSGDTWRALAASGGSFRFCANAEQAACNWLIEASSPESLCVSCRHNRTI